MVVWSEVKLNRFQSSFRWDPEYYQPANLKAANQLAMSDPLRIDDIAYVTDGIHASPDIEEDGGVRYLSAKCVKDNEFVLGDALNITLKQHRDNPRTSLRANDVLITTVGTIGNSAVVQKEMLPANADRHLGIVRLNSHSPIDPYFLASFLNSQFGRFQTFREATGNVQLNLFIEKIKELLIPVLPCINAVSQQTKSAYDKQREAKGFITAAEARLISALGLDRLDLSPSKTYARSFRELETGQCFGAEYYMPCKTRALEALVAMPHKLLNDYAPAIRDLFNPLNAKPTERVRNYDLTDALAPVLDDAMEPIDAQEVGSSKKRFKYGDVVVSRLRSYLKEIALVRTSAGIQAVGSSEFIVLRPRKNGLSAETLMIYLRCPIVQTILKWSQNGSNHPRFEERDLLAIPVPDKLIKVADEIDALVNASIHARREAADLLEKAKMEVEALITAKSPKEK